jgi:hypothetical protein
VIGSEEAKAGYANTLQVIALGMIDGGGGLGLSVHLPFDPESGESDSLARFLESEPAAETHHYQFQGIPCFYATFGEDVEGAFRAILHLLVQVFEYAPSDEFACTVSDDGPISKAGQHRAPPGGWSSSGSEE